MPIATNNIADTHRKELKSLEGGYVVARRLSFGEKLQRRTMVSGMKVQAEKGQKNFEGEMQLVSERATLFDFERCIVEHNLEKQINAGTENEAVVPMDLTKQADIKLLDPRVGEEIDEFLGELNNFEDDEEN